MKGVAHTLESFPSIDPHRVGAMGASFGGYMINWINGHTGQFRSLVNHDGIFNLPGFYYTTEELFFLQNDFKSPAFEDPTLYEKWSPHHHVKNWKTPCLVIHGGKDYRVPESEGLATFTALQRRGIKSRYVLFPEECHWVLNVTNSLRWHQIVLDWLSETL